MAKQNEKWTKKLKFYDKIASECTRFERKGKSMPYTSANGYMFSIQNHDAELGFRFSKEVQQQYFEKFKTSHIISYNAKMKGYILITPEMEKDEKLLVDLLNESFDYVMTLDPK